MSGKVLATVDAAVGVSAHEVQRFVDRAKRQRPDMSDAELLTALDRSYIGLVTTTGAAAGGLAAAPAVGLVGGAVAAVVDAGAFTSATGLYVLAVASVHGLDVQDIDRRKALLLAVLVGPGGAGVVERAAGRIGRHWGKQLVDAVPMEAIRQINRVLGPRFVTKYGTRQGVLVLGKMAPFGVGAAIGAGGNAVLARMAVRTTRSAFGPLPVVRAEVVTDAEPDVPRHQRPASRPGDSDPPS